MRTVLSLLSLFFISTLMAQEFQGVATYKSKRKVNIKLDSTQINSEMQAQIMARMQKQFEKTYTLNFDKESSLYKEEESLGAPQPQAGGAMVNVVMIDTGNGDILFKNTKENTYTSQNDVFGKIFLIKDKLEKLDWKLENETKNIGEYTCYKATMIRTQRVMQRTTTNINGKQTSEDKEELAPESREITVTAWYTPQIPVSSGPGNYYGLPGLILEVNDGSETLVCNKIVMNPKNKVVITEPKKGKEVSQEKFDEIMEKKMKEMNERQHNRRSGQGMQIRING